MCGLMRCPNQSRRQHFAEFLNFGGLRRVRQSGDFTRVRQHCGRDYVDNAVNLLGYGIRTVSFASGSKFGKSSV